MAAISAEENNLLQMQQLRIHNFNFTSILETHTYKGSLDMSNNSNTTSSNTNDGNDPTEIYVKVGKMPGKTTMKLVPEGSTAADVLRIAELDPTDHELRVNGVPANMSQVVRSKDSVLLLKPVAGN